MPRPQDSAPDRERNFFTGREEGMISLVSLFAVLGLLLLFGLFANVGRTATRKVETQNTADAASLAAANEMARAMNSFTAANHLMGELTALCVLHHGFGGDVLDKDPNLEPRKKNTFSGVPGAEGGDVNTFVGVTFNLAKAFCNASTIPIKPYEQAYEEVYKKQQNKTITGGAIGDSHTRLKQVLTWAYAAHAVAGLLWLIADVVQNIPIIGTAVAVILKIVAGIIAASAYAFELKCWQEMLVLRGLKLMAVGLYYTLKMPLMGKGGIPGLISALGNPTASYSTAVFAQTPLQMDKAVKGVSERNNAPATTYPPFAAKQAAAVAEAGAAAVDNDLDVPVAGMPVHRDQSKPPAETADYSRRAPNNGIPNPPVLGDNSYVHDHAAYTSLLTSNRNRPLKQWRESQLVRATTPWVQYWRVPFLRFGEDALLLSRFKCFYWDRTDEFTLKLTARLHLGKALPDDSGNKLFGVRPLVMKGWQPNATPQKGKEDWTKATGSARADELFGTVAFADRPTLPMTSGRIFRQPNPDGLTAYAQAMVYNANPQRDSSPNGFQPQIGWDTLNWENAVREFPGLRPNDDSYPVPDNVAEPRVRINWQAKLVPVSRLNEPAFLAAAAGGLYGPPIQRVSPAFLLDRPITKTH